MSRLVARKITKASLTKSADRELGVYRKLSSSGSANSECFAGLLDSFQIKGPNGLHTAFVFEPLGPHLRDVLEATPEFWHGSMFPDDVFFKNIPECQRFPKDLGKRVLKNVLYGLQYLHTYGIVHGDLHMGNILVTIRSLELNAATMKELQQKSEDGEATKRLDGKQDRWAPAYQLSPAGLLKYSSTELDPYIKITDLGGCK